MKAKSTLLAEARRTRVARTPARAARGATTRLPHATRRAHILAQAVEFFAANGLTAQTRALAEECGISQRLLYRFFPSKAALIEEVKAKRLGGRATGERPEAGAGSPLGSHRTLLRGAGTSSPARCVIAPGPAPSQSGMRMLSHDSCCKCQVPIPVVTV